MSKKFNQYLGKAGHLAIMSELLMRGWNVAIPEVDVGDDIFVVEDNSGTLRRVQVKTATASERKSGHTGQFFISLKQLLNLSPVPIHYVFILRIDDTWSKPLIIPQADLIQHVNATAVKATQRSHILLRLLYQNSQVHCSGQDFSAYICDYRDFPIIPH